MNIAVTAEYALQGRIPPRCRLPRTVYGEVEVVAEVREVDAADAPVAFVTDYAIEGPVEHRWFDGELYRLYLPHARQSEPSQVGSKYFPLQQELQRYQLDGDYDSAEEFKEIVRSYYDRFIVIDDVVWGRASEPRYVVMTFGMGYNHGSTALMPTEDMNSNILAERYFRADEYEEALAAAIEVAERRGDTESIDRFEPSITVFEPYAVKFESATHKRRGRVA